jgi:hypothetical protein
MLRKFYTKIMLDESNQRKDSQCERNHLTTPNPKNNMEINYKELEWLAFQMGINLVTQNFNSLVCGTTRSKTQKNLNQEKSSRLESCGYEYGTYMSVHFHHKRE